MSSSKIQVTKNYRLFQIHSNENRPLDLKKHRKLSESMKLYGFLHCFPIVVAANEAGVKIVKDGQHRLAIAEELGLPIYWVEETVDFDVAVVNSTSKVWQLADYAKKHASNGIKSYEEGLEFASRHGLPIGPAFSLLAGTTGFSNCQSAFIDGTFKIKDRQWAESVAGIYGPLVMMSPDLKTARFIEACMAICRVEGFDAKRLLANCERCREKLVSYSTRDAFLDMLEELYNFGRKQLVGLKAAAIMALRDRNIINKKKKSKATAEATA